jgi:hypothetical protein
MKTLLIMTVGQTDVQLVKDDQRHKFDGNTCGKLHDNIKERSWSVVDAPKARSRDLIKELPEGDLTLCTPKLDAVLAHFGNARPSSALILETNRQDERDPRLAGEVMARRLNDRDVKPVTRVAFLTENEQLEDPSNDVDAVVRRSVVTTLSDAIAKQVEPLRRDDKVYVATTGGLAAANEITTELVRLHSVGGPVVIALKVPDGNRGGHDDRAVEEKFHPAAGYRARWRALSLIERGNLLAAWGAVSHLEGAPGQEWTQVVQWLARFASSLPIPESCDIPILTHRRMAVRAALRVELALRAGDIPRAVHGTVAFFESALWDHLLDRFERTGAKNRGLAALRLKPGVSAPAGPELLRNDQSDEREKRNCPFERLDDGGYLFYEDGAGRFARGYVQSQKLKELTDAITKIKDLRNDVAHNEPTPDLIGDARRRMQEASLWSKDSTFLTQGLVQDVLRELGEHSPEQICESLIKTVRSRLLAAE